MADGPKIGDKIYIVSRGGWDSAIYRAAWLEVTKVTPTGQFTVDDNGRLRRFKPGGWNGAWEIGVSRRMSPRVFWGAEAEKEAAENAGIIRRMELRRALASVIGQIESRENHNDPAKLLALSDELKAAAQALVDFDAAAAKGAS